MDALIPEELRMLQSTVRQFVENEVMPLETEYQDELPPEVRDPLQARLRELGIWALSVPAEYGGADISTLGMTLVSEEIYKSMLSRNLIGGGVNPLLYNASDYLKEKYLHPVVRGEVKSAGAFSEPNAAGDLGGIETTAERDGDDYILNGTKVWIRGAHEADHVFVLARMKGTQRHIGTTWFIVDAGTPGFEVSRRIPMMGDTTLNELSFTDCVVPAAQRVTAEGGAWEAAQRSLNRARFLIGAEVLGMAERCQAMAMNYSKSRVTFGQPLAERQAVQFMLAESEIEMYATRAMVHEAARRVDLGEDLQREAGMIKVYSTEMAGRVIDRAMQIHGAAGYSKDLVIEQFYRAVRAVRIFEGPNEIHRWRLARNMLRD
ncbi:MAG: acyl-CoA dehydrogenase family protein [SAR202 cluster bacterium]|jgi:acyl-CoA dehydrogenase|nr:acyl-CoA dehydrogenase family protein [SAR202 cluster bacterium]|tara:strand:+ start:574 stop:1701 length:1128 start_codon:yes stop_codon:yes gene_type:complete